MKVEKIVEETVSNVIEDEKKPIRAKKDDVRIRRCSCGRTYTLRPEFFGKKLTNYDRVKCYYCSPLDINRLSKRLKIPKNMHPESVYERLDVQVEDTTLYEAYRPDPNSYVRPNGKPGRPRPLVSNSNAIRIAELDAQRNLNYIETPLLRHITIGGTVLKTQEELKWAYKKIVRNKNVN